MADSIITRSVAQVARPLSLWRNFILIRNWLKAFRAIAKSAAEPNAQGNRLAASPGVKREYDRAYRLRHGDVLRKREAEARKANPEIARRKKLAYVKWVAANAERRKAYQTAYRAANLDSLREHARAHNKKNSAKNVARAAAWVKNNPERAMAAKRILMANRRAQKLQGSRDAFSAGDIADIRRMQGDKCGACRVALHGKGHLDHIVALTKGAHDRRNAQLLRQSCEIGQKRVIQSSSCNRAVFALSFASVTA